MNDEIKKQEKDYSDIAKICIFLWIIFLFMPKMLGQKLSGTPLLNMYVLFTAAALICTGAFVLCFVKSLRKSRNSRVYAALLSAVIIGELICLALNFGYVADRFTGIQVFEGSRYATAEYEDGSGVITFFDSNGETISLTLAPDDFYEAANINTPREENGTKAAFREHEYKIQLSYYKKSGITKELKILR